MNNLKEKIETSKLIVTNIYDCIGRIESVAKTYECVEQGQVGILMPDGNMIDLNVLTDDQIASIKQSIKAQLDAAITEDSAYLDMISAKERKPAIINQDFEDAIKDMVESVKKPHSDVIIPLSIFENEKAEEIHVEEGKPLKIENTEPQKKLWTDEETLHRMYIKENKTATVIAEELGCKKQDVYNYLSKYGISKDNFKPGKQDFSKKKVTPSKTK